MSKDVLSPFGASVDWLQSVESTLVIGIPGRDGGQERCLWAKRKWTLSVVQEVPP
jgi:hypothetical protein